MKKLIGFTFGGFLILTGCSSVPKAGQGIMVGEVTSVSALAQVRLTKTDKLVRAHVEGPSEARWDVPGKAGVVELSLFAEGGSEVLAAATLLLVKRHPSTAATEPVPHRCICGHKERGI
jgi:hypothetical protein